MPEHPAEDPRERDAQAAHDWCTQVALTVAAKCAGVLAKVTQRRGLAHRHLIAAHVLLLIDGAGEDAVWRFLDELEQDLREAVTCR